MTKKMASKESAGTTIAYYMIDFIDNERDIILNVSVKHVIN